VNDEILTIQQVAVYLKVNERTIYRLFMNSAIDKRLLIAIHNDRANPLERLGGSVERVTFHSEASGFCVLRIKVRGRRDLSTVIGSAASVKPGEYVECHGSWINDRAHGLQFKAPQLKVVQP